MTTTHLRGIVAFGLVASTAACNPAWVPFKCEEGRFVVRMPGTPSPATQVIATATGPVTEYQFLLSEGPRLPPLRWLGRMPNAFYVSYHHIQAPPDNNDSAMSLLKDEQKRFLALGQATIVSERELSAPGCDRCWAREFVSRGPGDVYARVQLLVADSRVYQLGVGTAERLIWSPQADAFFASFQILGRNQKEGRRSGCDSGHGHPKRGGHLITCCDEYS